MVPSHEPAGVVAAVGPKCAGSWKVGDRVGVLNFKRACGECPGCGLWRKRKGTLDPRFCERRETAGFRHDGAFAEYMVADPSTTVRLPEGLSFAQAAPLMCAGVSSRKPLRLGYAWTCWCVVTDKRMTAGYGMGRPREGVG